MPARFNYTGWVLRIYYESHSCGYGAIKLISKDAEIARCYLMYQYNQSESSCTFLSAINRPDLRNQGFCVPTWASTLWKIPASGRKRLTPVSLRCFPIATPRVNSREHSTSAQVKAPFQRLIVHNWFSYYERIQGIYPFGARLTRSVIHASSPCYSPIVHT